MNIAAILIIGGVLAVGDAPPEKKAKPATPPSSLDEDLFGDLTGDLFDGLDAPKLGDSPAKKTSEKEPLPGQLGQGEDLGQPTDPLTKLGQRMRRVESLIAKIKAGGATQKIQDAIVRDLDSLIELIRKQQCEACKNGGKPSQGKKSPGKPKNSAGKKQGTGEFRPNPNPTGSDEGVRKTNVKKPRAGGMLAFRKEVWGKLPHHWQEAIRNAQSSKFLNEYAEEVREYFARLAELSQQSEE